MEVVRKLAASTGAGAPGSSVASNEIFKRKFAELRGQLGAANVIKKVMLPPEEVNEVRPRRHLGSL